ncbi:MAG TPA: CNNM domain-containing protein [Verrucomicrobiota bacterium]|nr:CNNM domain-containing protein [Verrucomicrobiota bacterium]HNT15125.1 CNNM domain-containing protein [Verrucomicrobiota bacterium]
MEINLLSLIGLAFCLGVSFLLSGMEAGVFALSRLRVRRLTRTGDVSARLLHQFLENPENFLWTIVVGNTLFNFVALGSFFAVLHHRVALRSGWFWCWFLVAVLVFYTFFDLLPKILFRLYPNRLCLWLARPFRVLHIGLRPLVMLVEWVAHQLLRWTGGRRFSRRLFGNREELRAATQESEQVFTSDERVMISRVLDLENVAVRQVMRPLSEAVSISAADSVVEALAASRASGFTRFPVWAERDGVRRVAGVVNVDDLIYHTDLDGQTPVGAWLTPGLFLPEDIRLDVALERMQRGGQRLAIVLGPDGRETGIVGLDDILKTIFGEVQF